MFFKFADVALFIEAIDHSDILIYLDSQLGTALPQ